MYFRLKLLEWQKRNLSTALIKLKEKQSKLYQDNQISPWVEHLIRSYNRRIENLDKKINKERMGLP